jgi:hypothetical protein
VTAQPKRRGQDIVNGATPADLAVRQPTIFALTITLKTVKIPGLKIRQPILNLGGEGIG